MICPKCKAMLPNNLISCTKCGAILQPGYEVNNNSGQQFTYNGYQQSMGTGQLYGQNQGISQQPMGTGQLYGQNQGMPQQPMGTGQLYGQNQGVPQPSMGAGQPYGNNLDQNSSYNPNYQQNYHNPNGKWENGKWVKTQPNQMNYSNPNWNQKPKSNVGCLSAIFFGICFVLFLLILPSLSRYIQKSREEDGKNVATTERQTTYEESTTYEEPTEETIDESIPNITVASDYSNMTIGDICCEDDLYIGLAYAKLSDSFTTGLGSQEDISEGKQVLFAYFDVYNGSNDKKNIGDDSFTCYVDGTSFSKVETYFYYEEDGITNQLSNDLYDNTNKMVITDFEIPMEWNEIKLYYGSDCIWTLLPADVSSEPFEMKSMYDIDYIRDATPEGTTIYSDKYEITYDGYEYFTQDYTNDEMIIIKFTVNNTGDSELDYSLVGYNMNCYADNYVTNNADYTLDEKFGDYINVYNIDSIQAGMNAKIYYAFEINGNHTFYRMTYDVGYIVDEYLADIYIKVDSATNTDAED